ncbi:MAG TPA: hypothetical protein VIU61_18595 [Kofleriaceae bacterium]
MRLFALLVISPLATLGGCGGVTAESPLTVSLGIPRDQARIALEHHKYCRKQDGPPQKTETFVRCDRPGLEWGESWVVAHYDGDTLVELKRYERFSDDARAVERWNQLVEARTKVTPMSAEADRVLRDKLLEPGTRTVKAFRVDAGTLAGVYLLTPTPPEDASILEAIIRIR